MNHLVKSISEAKIARPGRVVLGTEEIADVVARLGREISRDYAGRNPILVNLLKGGVVFLADLMRQLDITHQIDFLHVSSYENGTASSGRVRIVDDLSCSVEGRDVLIVEDVIDTGTTLAYIVNVLQLRSPRSLEVCTLLKKGQEGAVRMPIRYVGKVIPSDFVVGYGLDYEESFRNLPYIASLEFVDRPSLIP
jgi:hypoxanthine phosphoribosyltransferase